MEACVMCYQIKGSKLLEAPERRMPGAHHAVLSGRCCHVYIFGTGCVAQVRVLRRRVRTEGEPAASSDMERARQRGGEPAWLERPRPRGRRVLQRVYRVVVREHLHAHAHGRDALVCVLPVCVLPSCSAEACARRLLVVGGIDEGSLQSRDYASKTAVLG
eukprot:6050881-Pleurochrysis_carterae.AAC.6